MTDDVPTPPRPDPWTTSAPREGLRDNNAGRIVSLAPSCNRTPLGASMVVVPYPMVDFCGHDGAYSENVRMTGQRAMLHSSITLHVHGDAPGTGGGVVSGTTGGICEPIEHAPKVRANGKFLMRDGDRCWMNNRNTQGEAQFVRDTTVYPAPKDTDPIPGAARTILVDARSPALFDPNPQVSPVPRVSPPVVPAAPPGRVPVPGGGAGLWGRLGGMGAALGAAIGLAELGERYGPLKHPSVQGYDGTTPGHVPLGTELDPQAGTGLLFHPDAGGSPLPGTHAVPLTLQPDGRLLDPGGNPVGRWDGQHSVTLDDGVDPDDLFERYGRPLAPEPDPDPPVPMTPGVPYGNVRVSRPKCRSETICFDRVESPRQDLDAQLQMQQDALNAKTPAQVAASIPSDGQVARLRPQALEAQRAARETFRRLGSLQAPRVELNGRPAWNSYFASLQAIHRLDMVAGGDPKDIVGMGDATANGSIGPQWTGDSRRGTLRRYAAEMAENKCPMAVILAVC